MPSLDHWISERPEFIALAMLLLGALVTRWSANRAPATRVGTRVPMFLAFTYFLFRAHQVPYLAAVPPADALERILGDGMRAIWWLWVASIGANLVHQFSFRSAKFTAHRFFTDLAVAGIYLLAFVGLITFVFNFPVQGLLVTSGAVAVILGLALQSSLGDVFYGVVLNLGKPYGEGDWISLDNGVEGRVLEMNWRATHLLTLSQDVVIVPNSVVGKSKIINSSSPSRVHGTTIPVLLAPATQPAVARRILSDAINGCHLVLSAPPPIIVIRSMSQEGILIEATFFTTEISRSLEAQNQVYEKINRCLGAAGIGLGARTTALPQQPQDLALRSLGEGQRLVAFTPVFARLPASESAAIAASMVREVFEAGSTVIERDRKSEAMYVVYSGVLSATRDVAGTSQEIGRLCATDHFGAAGLLDGRQSTLKVTALTLAVVYRLEKKDLMRLVEAMPGFAAGLNRELAARQLLAHNAADAHDGTLESEDSLANWFANLFRRPDSDHVGRH
jgi:small-conductance mechanosensitive channel/CRP-like cAMP-binding protein